MLESILCPVTGFFACPAPRSSSFGVTMVVWIASIPSYLGVRPADTIPSVPFESSLLVNSSPLTLNDAAAASLALNSARFLAAIASALASVCFLIEPVPYLLSPSLWAALTCFYQPASRSKPNLMIWWAMMAISRGLPVGSLVRSSTFCRISCFFTGACHLLPLIGRDISYLRSCKVGLWCRETALSF